VANLTWAYATLGKMPSDSTWAALETAAGQMARDMKAQEVANLAWAYATLGRMPNNNTWAALETAVGRVAPDMNAQEVANLTWAYATLGRMPGASTWAALETAAGRLARDMESQHVVNLLYAYTIISIVQHTEYPSCYTAVWDQVSSLKLRDFSREALCMLFHVHLMHSFSSSKRPATVQYPTWLMVEARDEWMRNVRDDHTCPMHTGSLHQSSISSASDTKLST